MTRRGRNNLIRMARHQPETERLGQVDELLRRVPK
jgi:hypothetical protein